MKPIQKVIIETLEGNIKTVDALFDSGSFYNIIRRDKLPVTKNIYFYDTPRKFGTAAQNTSLQIIGKTDLIVELDNHRFDDPFLISDSLSRNMIIGAGTMQKWDITIINKKGNTEIKVGRDMRDPEITEVV